VATDGAGGHDYWAITKVPEVFGANQHGRWITCGVCGVRLGYWPRQGSKGATNRLVCPALVRDALAELRSTAKWPNDIIASDVQTAMVAIGARQRAPLRLLHAPLGHAKSTNKQAECERDRVPEPTDHRVRAVSVSAREVASMPARDVAGAPAQGAVGAPIRPAVEVVVQSEEFNVRVEVRLRRAHSAPLI
jgi:hypothetical protein